MIVPNNCNVISSKTLINQTYWKGLFQLNIVFFLFFFWEDAAVINFDLKDKVVNNLKLEQKEDLIENHYQNFNYLSSFGMEIAFLRRANLSNMAVINNKMLLSEEYLWPFQTPMIELSALTFFTNIFYHRCCLTGSYIRLCLCSLSLI